MSSSEGLPPNKRYIATHTPEGKSVYLSSPQTQSPFDLGVGTLSKSYAVSSVPADLTAEADIKAYLAPASESVTSRERREIVIPRDNVDGSKGTVNGANLLVVDMKPGGMSQMHRTVSIDFSICTIGTIEHVLDSGEKVTLRPGDHIVQRGTNHKWINASQTEWARFVAVTLPAIPFDIPGFGMLKEHFAADEPDEKSNL